MAVLTRRDGTVVLDDGASSQSATLQQAFDDSLLLTDLNLQNWDLTGISIAGADLRGSDCQGANFTVAQMANVQLAGCTFDANNVWTNVVLAGARFGEATLDGGEFVGINLGNAVLNLDFQFVGSSWKGCTLTNCLIVNCDMRDTDWTDAVLTGNNFAGSDFTGATNPPV